MQNPAWPKIRRPIKRSYELAHKPNKPISSDIKPEECRQTCLGERSVVLTGRYPQGSVSSGPDVPRSQFALVSCCRCPHSARSGRIGRLWNCMIYREFIQTKIKLNCSACYSIWFWIVVVLVNCNFRARNIHKKQKKIIWTWIGPIGDIGWKALVILV